MTVMKAKEIRGEEAGQDPHPEAGEEGLDLEVDHEGLDQDPGNILDQSREVDH